MGVVKHYYCNSLDLENFKPLTEEIEKKTFLTNESWSICNDWETSSNRKLWLLDVIKIK